MTTINVTWHNPTSNFVTGGNYIDSSGNAQGIGVLSAGRTRSRAVQAGNNYAATVRIVTDSFGPIPVGTGFRFFIIDNYSDSDVRFTAGGTAFFANVTQEYPGSNRPSRKTASGSGLDNTTFSASSKPAFSTNTGPVPV